MRDSTMNSRQGVHDVSTHEASTEVAAPVRKPNRGNLKHGDAKRKRIYKRYGYRGIDARTRAGRPAIKWRRYALERKGGKSCAIDLREKIDAGAFYLWRALELRDYLIKDARKRGTPLNRRYNKLPLINEQYDTAMNQWQRINDELELDKGLDLAMQFKIKQLQGGK